MIPRRPLVIAAATTFALLARASGDDVCPTGLVQPSSVMVEVAPGGTVESRGSLISAKGGVSLLSGRYKVRASEVLVDTRLGTGTMRDAVFTTCDKAVPDYRFQARELSFLPGNRIHARGASLFLGRFKMLTLPSVKVAVGRRGFSTDTFPRPGFDKDDGFGISQKLTLVDTDRLQVGADVRVTAKRGLEGELESVWGVDGDLAALPGRYLTYESLRSSVLTMPRTFGREPYSPAAADTSGIARLRQFGRFSLRQRTYDVRNTGLLLYRQPEIGLAYTGSPLNLARTCLDPRLEIYPTVNVSWGRFRETPGAPAFTGRTLLGVVVGGNILPLGPRTAVQPLAAYTVAAYQGGLHYSTFAYALDAGHITPNGSIASVRYIKRDGSGASPFLFDTINIAREFQAAFQLRVGSQVIGFVAGCDADKRKVYDWQGLVGYHTDCLAAWVTYDNLLRRLMFDVALVNL